MSLFCKPVSFVLPQTSSTSCHVKPLEASRFSEHRDWVHCPLFRKRHAVFHSTSVSRCDLGMSVLRINGTLDELHGASIEIGNNDSDGNPKNAFFFEIGVSEVKCQARIYGDGGTNLRQSKPSIFFNTSSSLNNRIEQEEKVGEIGGNGGSRGGDNFHGGNGDDENDDGEFNENGSNSEKSCLYFYKEHSQTISDTLNRISVDSILSRLNQCIHSFQQSTLASVSSSFNPSPHVLSVHFFMQFLLLLLPFPSLAKTSTLDQSDVPTIPMQQDESSAPLLDFRICENRGSKRTCYTISPDNQVFISHEKIEEGMQASPNFDGLSKSEEMHEKGVKDDDQSISRRIIISTKNLVNQINKSVMTILLPANFPHSVTDDYFEYTVWRMAQGIASEANRVLTTQALLFAIGLGKGAIPSAAALNWVLKDGIGYLSKIALSQFGKQFDVNPKGTRFLADIAEDLSCGFELLTPAFPSLFVPLAALAGAGLSGSGLVQAATRSCFYAGFAAKRNYADLIAKGEAQGMVSKCCGIGLGIFLSSRTGAFGFPLLLTYFSLTSFHLLCNLKSYQAVTLRTLNTYRASLVFGEYLHSNRVPSVKEVNREEPFFPALTTLKLQHWFKKNEENGILSDKTKHLASSLYKWLEFGSSLGLSIKTKKDYKQLEEIYQNEKYMLSIQGNKGRVVLRKDSTPKDLLRCMLQACYLMKELDGMDLKSPNDWFGALKNSHTSMDQTFDEIKNRIANEGWINDGLVAKLAPHRLLNAPSM